MHLLSHEDAYYILCRSVALVYLNSSEVSIWIERLLLEHVLVDGLGAAVKVLLFSDENFPSHCVHALPALLGPASEDDELD